MYVGVPWNILEQIQKFNVCKFPCNSVSSDDVDHFCAAGFGRIRGLMFPIRDPFVATIMVVSIPSYIPSFMENLWANFWFCAQDTPSQMGCVIR